MSKYASLSFIPRKRSDRYTASDIFCFGSRRNFPLPVSDAYIESQWNCLNPGFFFPEMCLRVGGNSFLQCTVAIYMYTKYSPILSWHSIARWFTISSCAVRLLLTTGLVVGLLPHLAHNESLFHTTTLPDLREADIYRSLIKDSPSANVYQDGSDERTPSLAGAYLITIDMNAYDNAPLRSESKQWAQYPSYYVSESTRF